MNLHRSQQLLLSLIESALNILVPKAETSDELMETLLDQYILPSSILESNADALIEVCDPIFPDADFLCLIPSLYGRILQEPFGEHPILDCFDVAKEYLMTMFIGVNVEHFYALYLDDGGRLIFCRCLQEGSIDEAPFYLDQLIQDIIEFNAHAVILSHNHPGESLYASEADIECTVMAITALFSINVLVLDHIIVAGDQAVSLRESPHIPADSWIGQAPDSALLRNWLATKASRQ